MHNSTLFNNCQTICTLYKKSIVRVAILLCPIFFLIPACTSKMSVEKAKKITVSMSAKSFVPPPRSIDDILTQLSQYHESRSKVANELEAKLHKSSPQNSSPEALANYYHNRGTAAMYLGRAKQAFKDLRLALDYSKLTAGQNHRLIQRVALTEFAFGNYKRAIELFEQSLRLHESPACYDGLVKIHARLGDLETAKKYKNRGVSLCNQFSRRRDSGPWPAMSADRMRAYVLEAQARFEEAEIYHRRVLKSNTRSFIHQYPLIGLAAKQSLIRNLKNQRRFMEAELVARENLMEMLSLSGSDSAFSGHCVSDLADIFFRQGRLDDADKLLRIAIRKLNKAGVSTESYMMVETMIRLGEVLTAKEELGQAAVQFDLAQSGIKENRFLYEKYFARNPAIMITLLQTGRLDEATQQIETVYAKNSSVYGTGHYLTKEVQSLRGMANLLQNKEQAAFADFSTAIPVLLQDYSMDTFDYAKNVQLKTVTESYMKLLVQWAKKSRRQDVEMDPAAEVFRLADALSGRSVESAIVASSARAAAFDPELADLIRKEQDASLQIVVFQMSLAENMATSEDQQLLRVVSDLQHKLATLIAARNTLQTAIKKHFPKYFDLTAPDLVSILEVQRYLRPSEALVYIYPASDATYVWAVSQKRTYAFAQVKLGRKELHTMIEKLRRALDPSPNTFGDIPEFDLALAHFLYSQLLKPVADGWKGAEDLLIVAPWPLGQLPFAVLPTAATPAKKKEALLFSQYRDVPWLIRNVSITRLPSAATFVTLRKLPTATPQQRPFAGFGDPVFNLAQVESGNQGQPIEPQSFESRGTRLYFRGIRITDAGRLDSAKITSSHLESLQRLPDTAEELENIKHCSDSECRPAAESFFERKSLRTICKDHGSLGSTGVGVCYPCTVAG